MVNLKVLVIAILLTLNFSRGDDKPSPSPRNPMKEGLQVTYDRRALVIDGQRRILSSGSIHYPRSAPEMWPGLISKARDGGLDVIQTYVFWSGHERHPGQYYFGGRYDLVRFIKLVQNAGLYVNLRIGPYVCAEWNFGGFPAWLNEIPGIAFRTDNQPFKQEMRRFVQEIVSLMRKNNLFAEQGGPIILGQIENEYGNVQSAFGDAGQRYMEWAAALVTTLNTTIPWIMCQQGNAPANIINTCNGFYCDNFEPSDSNKPKMWTENWTGWFHHWQGSTPHRPVQDIAFAVARFFQRGGSFQNYYMYYGGTNFERSSGGPFITTSYDYDAPIDEYGHERYPKWGHLRKLHLAIRIIEPTLVASDSLSLYLPLSDSGDQEAYLYSDVQNATSVEQILRDGRLCAALLSNTNTYDATVTFNGQAYDLPGWSVSILPDCQTSVYNTAKITEMSVLSDPSAVWSSSEWVSYQEPTGVSLGSAFYHAGLLEQIRTTHDLTDYLWYTTSLQVSETEHSALGSSQASISITSLRDGVYIFVNSELQGGRIGSGSSLTFDLEQAVTLRAGINDIALLCFTVGLQNYGARLEAFGAGIQGKVTLRGLPSGERDLGAGNWTYQAGLQGESWELFSRTGCSSVLWSSVVPSSNQSLMWYKSTFKSPPEGHPLALDLSSMGKGQAWINGFHLGRYWATVLAPATGCSPDCNWRGRYDPSKCASGCGRPSQVLYHVPRSFISEENDNLLVLFEESRGNVSGVTLRTLNVSTVCGHVTESDPPPIEAWDPFQEHSPLPEVQLRCSEGLVISGIKFASYGNAQGRCGEFQVGTCHVATSLETVSQACSGKSSCALGVGWRQFSAVDPCPGTAKSLAVEAECALPSSHETLGTAADKPFS